MADWDVVNSIDYSPNGDDIDTFAQKVKAEEEVIYQRVARVRSNDASAGATVSDAVPYQWKIDTSTEPATMLMLDGRTNRWVRIGFVAENFGLNTADLGGVTNAGGISTFQLGKDMDKPATAASKALYFAYDAKKIYVFTGTAWEVFLSLDYDDIIDKEQSAVSWDDVATSGANKVAKFNAEGEIDANITGSPAKIANKTISAVGLAGNQALVYDGNRWVNQKVATVDNANIADVSITGNAAKVANKSIVTSSLTEGDALVYDGTNFKNQQVALINDSGQIQGSITGSAAKVAGVTIRTDGDLSDGQVLVYRSATNTFTNESKGGIGDAKALSVQRGGEEVLSYDGSDTKTLPLEMAVAVGETLPETAPIHFVEVQS